MGVPAGAITRRLVLPVAVGAAYYAGARLGLQLSLVEHNVTPLWPPTGIAVAAFLLFGRSLWPAVAVAAFLVNLPISEHPAAAAVTAAGNLLAPLLAAVALGRLGFRRQLDRQRDAHLIVLVAVASSLVSATVGALTLVASGAIDSDGFAAAWAVWWTGDAMGVLLVAPFLLAIPLFWEQPRWRTGQLAEALVLGAAAAAVSFAGVLVDLPVLFPVLPILGWTAWRLQLRGAAPVALMASVTTTWLASHEHGIFADGTLLERMLALQLFNVCVALASFFLAALVTERLRTEQVLEQREHDIAEALQRTLLPDRLPVVPGIRLAARYVPATLDVQVGGDWYDVVSLPGGLIGLAIGDVAGHGLPAAAAMGQLRMSLRAHAFADPSPDAVMAGLHRLVDQVPGHPMATVLYLVFDPATRRVRFASAGHPPALLTWRGDGRAGQSRFLEEALSPPVGVTRRGEYEVAEFELAPGSDLILYTDGLVERRGSSIQDGLDRLQRAAVAGQGDEIELLCDRLLEELLRGVRVEDDVALLVLRTDPVGAPLRVRLPAEPRSLAPLRGALRRWLRENGVGDDEAGDILVACGEACSNVVEHAYSVEAGTLDVAVSLVEGTVRVRVRDQGAWRPEAERGGGWGIELTRALMDSVEVRGGRAGTQVEMVRTVRIGERQ